MNVADLLQEAPSDKRRPPQREQPPPPLPPPPRERSRDRQLSSQGQQPAQQHTAHPPPSQHQQPSPPQPYRPPPSSKHSRPSSPPRSYQHDYGSSHSQQSQQRLPPPSAIIESLVGPRREDPQQLPPPHEQSSRSQYGQPSLGPPGPLSQQQQQPYNDHPSSRSQSRSSSNSHTHHQSQSHGHSSVQSSMYMPPPNSRSSLQQISKHGASSSGPGMPPPGHGSVPLYPTPVGPGMGPPPHHMESHPRASYSEPSVMYSGHPHAPPGASIMGALPPPHSHSSHAHQQHPSIHSRHRRTGSGGYHSQGGSPAMGSLQRSPYDERGGPLPPPSQLGGVMGPGQSPSLSREPSNASLRNAHMLTGPGAAGMHANPISSREREHYERERVREREREMEGRSMERRERELRGRDRDRMERELRERERARERERREEERMHERDAMVATVGPDGLTEADREREWRRMQPPEPHAWPRFANPRIGDEKRDRDFAMQQQLEWERDREREREIAMMDEKRAMDAAREMERTRQAQSARTSTREREPREKDRTRDADRGGRRDKHPDLRRVSGDDHGWLPEPPVQEVWTKDGRERDRDRELRDRMLREREREIRESENLELVRASRQSGQNPQHHHHVHHHLHRHQHQQQVPPGGSQSHSKATKIRPIESEMAGPPIGPGGMPPPMSDLPPPSGLHKSMSKSSLGPGPGPGPGQMSHPQLPPQHFHPSNRLHPHPSHSFGNQSPMHYGRRPSPPPFTNALNVSNNFMQPRSPRPPMLPTVPPVHVGTFVFPRTPFPFLDFPSPPDSATSLLPQKEIPEIRAIIYMPSGFLPTRRPKEPRIWGGALVPSFSPIFAAPQLVNHMQSGMSYGYPKPHPLEIHGLRRVYTDDSDLFLCALHAGWVTWNMTRAAQEDGKDLRLEIRLTREARFIGGFGERYRGQEPRESSEEDDGRGLLSAGWGNSHEGAGIEILRAEFVKKGTAHKFGLRNRSQRLAEHNERSITLGCVPQVRKRKRRAVWYDEDEEETPTVHDTFLAADAKLCASRTLVLGYQLRPSTCGFKYDADAVKSALFPENTDSARPTKKRRLAITGLQMRVNGVARSAEPSQGVDDSVVIETLAETFLISPQAVDVQDKENAVSSRRYTVFLVNRQSTKPVQSKLDSGATPTVPAGVLTEGKEQPKTTSSTAKPSAEEPSSDDKTTGAVAVDAGLPTSDVNGVSKSSADEASIKTAEDTSMAADAPDTKTSPEPHASKAPSTGGSSTPMDLETPEPRSEGPSSPTPPAKAASPAVMEVEAQETEAQLAPPEPEPKEIPPIQVLQKNLTEDDLLFDTDGISILSSDVENGMRSGWKIEAKTWRWADESLISLV